jgi:hypothetical protein
MGKVNTWKEGSFTLLIGTVAFQAITEFQFKTSGRSNSGY